MAQRTPRWHSLLRGKPVDAFVNETRPDAEGGELSRSIGLFQLTMIGVGATIGTGIFSSVVRRYRSSLYLATRTCTSRTPRLSLERSPSAQQRGGQQGRREAVAYAPFSESIPEEITKRVG